MHRIFSASDKRRFSLRNKESLQTNSLPFETLDPWLWVHITVTRRGHFASGQASTAPVLSDRGRQSLVPSPPIEKGANGIQDIDWSGRGPSG